VEATGLYQKYKSMAEEFLGKPPASKEVAPGHLTNRVKQAEPEPHSLEEIAGILGEDVWNVSR
jgi:hypothetical protein